MIGVPWVSSNDCRCVKLFVLLILLYTNTQAHNKTIRNWGNHHYYHVKNVLNYIALYFYNVLLFKNHVWMWNNYFCFYANTIWFFMAVSIDKLLVACHLCTQSQTHAYTQCKWKWNICEIAEIPSKRNKSVPVCTITMCTVHTNTHCFCLQIKTRCDYYCNYLL